MDSCGSFVKFLLFLFNLIFALSGIGIIVAGAFVLADIGDFSYFIENRILVPPIVLVVVGAVVFIVAFLGCFGAVRESHSMLISFAVCLLIIFILEMAVGIAAAIYKGDFEIALKETLKESMAHYADDESNVIAWDSAQKKLQCCGVDGYGDWQGQGLPLPLSCCTDMELDLRNIFPYCIKAGRGNYLFEEGCYAKLQRKINANSKILIGVGIGIAFIEVMGIALACWLAAVIKNEEEEEEEKDDGADDTKSSKSDKTNS